MSADWPWSVLGLDGPTDKKTIMKAYAAKLKSSDRDDPAAFQALRKAREYALGICENSAPKARPNMREAAFGGSNGKETHQEPPKNILIHEEASAPPLTSDVDNRDHVFVERKALQAALNTEYARQETQPQLHIWEGAAVDRFWNDYNSAIETDQFAEAAKCLDRPLAQDREIRQKAEQIAIVYLKTKSPNFRFHVDDLDLFEGEFRWLSDSISLSNRAGYFPNLVRYQSEWNRLQNLRRNYQKYGKPETSPNTEETRKSLNTVDLLITSRPQHFLISCAISTFWLILIILSEYIPFQRSSVGTPSEILSEWFIIWTTYVLVSYFVVFVLERIFLMFLNVYYQNDPIRTSEFLGNMRKIYRRSPRKYFAMRGAVYTTLVGMLGAAYVTFTDVMILITIYLLILGICYFFTFFILNDFLGFITQSLLKLKRRNVAWLSMLISVILTTWLFIARSNNLASYSSDLKVNDAIQTEQTAQEFLPQGRP